MINKSRKIALSASVVSAMILITSVVFVGFRHSESGEQTDPRLYTVICTADNLVICDMVSVIEPTITPNTVEFLEAEYGEKVVVVAAPCVIREVVKGDE